MHSIIEQDVHEEQKGDPGSIISASSPVAALNTSSEEQVRGPIVDQTGMLGVEPGLPAQGLSNHPQIKQLMANQTTMSSDSESEYELPPIREDTPASTAASQDTDLQGYHLYNPPNSFYYSSSQTPSGSEVWGTETPSSCGDGQFCCHDPDCQEARAPLQYSSPGEKTQSEWLFDADQIKGVTQVVAYGYCPQCLALNGQTYPTEGRENKPGASQDPLGSVSQGYYYAAVGNSTHPSYRPTIASEYEAPMILSHQNIGDIIVLRSKLKQGGHLQNCYSDNSGMNDDPENPTICSECWKKLDAAESLLLFWQNPVVHPNNDYQARAMARITPPPAKPIEQVGQDGKEKASLALEPAVTRNAEPNPRAHDCKDIDQTRFHEQQESEGQQVEAEHVNPQEPLPEVNLEE